MTPSRTYLPVSLLEQFTYLETLPRPSLHSDAVPFSDTWAPENPGISALLCSPYFGLTLSNQGPWE